MKSNKEIVIKNRLVPLTKTSNQKHEVLFLLPPNIEFEDFVNPPSNISTIQKGERLFGSVITDIPLGPISLSAYLKKFVDLESTSIDFNVTLNKDDFFDCNDFKSYFRSKLETTLKEDYAPDYVAISALFTPAYQSIIDLAELAKEFFPQTLVIIGGNLPTSMYKEILTDSMSTDAVCFGEGEKPFLALIEAEDKIKYLNSSQSWVTHENLQNNEFNLEHDYIWDLDEIPFLDYDMLDIEGYKLNPTSSRYSVTDKYEVDNEDEDLVMEETRGKMLPKADIEGHSMPIMTSRGCPFKCTFCASHAAHGRDMRYNSIDRVKKDLAIMIDKYKINGVVVQDDHFMAGRRRPYEVVASIGKLNLEMFFQNALAMYALDVEFLQLLKDSGVHELVLPVESGSSRVLKEEMRKPLKLDIIPRVVKNCREVGIYTDCNIIIGMPGETKQDIIDSREFLKTIYADWFRIFVATPIPGSEMHETVLHNDGYKVAPIKGNYKRAIIETPDMSPEYIQFMTYYMNIELNFVFNANMRLGRYKTALEGFKNVINVKPDHALAHYYAYKCLDALGQESVAKAHLNEAELIISRTDFWNVFIEDFDIELTLPQKAMT
jgi:anaerobic magnesium-protoporphyrin IX monomethyl ester cyclase